MSSRTTKIYHSFSSAGTKAFGKRLARKAAAKIEKASARAGDKRAIVFALTGDLGAGKTTFVQGFLEGLRARGRAASPTFVIMRRHPLPRGRGTESRQMREATSAYHVDAYRLKKPGDLAALGFEDILADRRNIVLIEWAEKVKRFLPKRAVWLHFRHGGKINERRISVSHGL